MTTTLRPVPDDEDDRAVPGVRAQRFALCANGRPIGTLRVAAREADGWIADLHVVPDRRRRGHGSVGVLAAEEILRGWGCRRVLVDIPDAAADARALGEALGYTVTAQHMAKRVDRPPALPAGVAARPLTAA